MSLKQTIHRVAVYLLAVITIALLLSVGGIAASAKSADGTSPRTREINIVYDDSGSMYDSTSWSQAKYALEVFVAMMHENDTLNIYELSQEGKRPVSLEGKQESQARVSTVDSLSGSGNTPFGPVRMAGEAIMKSKADEKWLVIITDGSFADAADPASEILSYVGQNNTKVVYISIGHESYVMDMTPFARELFYPYHTDEDRILDTMTSAASLVFNYKPISLTVDDSGEAHFDVDIPLEKIIVFAQGEGATVQNFLGNGAELQHAAGDFVRVKVDAASGGAEYGSPIAHGLNGVVYTAETTDAEKPFADGQYSFSCNVRNVQVFVEPGVSVEAVLRGSNGEAINTANGDVNEIPEGEWVVDVQLINPLTGNPIPVADSRFLADASLDVVVLDDQGNSRVFGNGETITVSGKKMQLYGRASFLGMNGTIEKTSPMRSFQVVKAKLFIGFSQPSGYSLDAVMLQPKDQISFQVSIAGKPLTAEQSDRIEFKVENTDGIAWTVEKNGDDGTFQLIPSFAKRNGVDSVSGGETELTVSATLKEDGEKREGQGSVKLIIVTETLAGLQLTMTMPPESLSNAAGDQKYMFDCNQLGPPSGESGDLERPFILVEVKVADENGAVRPLSEEEWDQGVNNFRYQATERYPNFLWNLAQLFVLGQDLNFAAVKGELPSTYKLYLAPGLPPFSRNVLPNTSDLNVALEIKYGNGVKLSGDADGVVSVLPLPLWTYLIWLIAILVAVVLILAFIIREVKKPHFPREFSPNNSVSAKGIGGALQLVHPDFKLRYHKSHRWSLSKPEICKVKVYDKAPDSTGVNFSFTLIASDNKGAFRLKSLVPFAGYDSVLIGGTPLNILTGDTGERSQIFSRHTRIQVTQKFNGATFTKDIKFI